MGMVQCCMACVVNQADMRFDPCKIAQHNCQKASTGMAHVSPSHLSSGVCMCEKRALA